MTDTKSAGSVLLLWVLASCLAFGAAFAWSVAYAKFASNDWALQQARVQEMRDATAAVYAAEQKFRLAEAALQAAEGNLAHLQTEQQRLEAQYRKGAVTAQQLEAGRAALNIARTERHEASVRREAARVMQQALDEARIQSDLAVTEANGHIFHIGPFGADVIIRAGGLAVIGLMAGPLQSLVLPHEIRTVWILSNALGFSVFPLTLPLGAVIQWLILRRRSYPAGSFLLASIIVPIVGSIVGFVVLIGMFFEAPPITKDSPVDYVEGAARAFGVVGAGVGAVVGVVTGRVLLRLLRQGVPTPRD